MDRKKSPTLCRVLSSFLIPDVVGIILLYTGPTEMYTIKLYDEPGAAYPNFQLLTSNHHLQICSSDEVVFINEFSCYNRVLSACGLSTSQVVPLKIIPSKPNVHQLHFSSVKRPCYASLCQHVKADKDHLVFRKLIYSTTHTSTNGKLESRLWVFLEGDSLFMRIDTRFLENAIRRISTSTLVLNLEADKFAEFHLACDWDSTQKYGIVCVCTPSSTFFISNITLNEKQAEWFTVPCGAILPPRRYYKDHKSVFLAVSAKDDLICVYNNIHPNSDLGMYPLTGISGKDLKPFSHYFF